MSATVSRTDAEYVASLFPELEQISDPSLREKVVDIWVEVWHESSWEKIEDAPKNPANLPDNRSLVDHTRAVTLEALAAAKVLEEVHHISLDHDTIVAASLLHDVSKLVEYERGDDGARTSQTGRLIQHAVYGAHKAWTRDLPEEIVHIIVSHTQNSRKAPRTLECAVVHYVDYLDTDALLFDAGEPMLVAKAH
jgi:putative nucleotidyltransferase with HDIG domain